jgi:hypothetical protein
VAAASVDEFAGTKANGKRGKGRKTKADLAAEVERVGERLRSNDWSELRPGDLVAAHAFCHQSLYGEHDDLLGDNWRRASVSAYQLVKCDFDGDLVAGLAFVRWAWQRERKREERRKRNGSDGEGHRLVWRHLFVTRWILTDYRVESRRADG